MIEVEDAKCCAASVCVIVRKEINNKYIVNYRNKLKDNHPVTALFSPFFYRYIFFCLILMASLEYYFLF